MKAIINLAFENIWKVLCGEDGAQVKPPQMPQKNRDRPASVAIPNDLFRTSCRMIEVVVGKGEDSTTFVVHEPLLTASSAYFRDALAMASKDDSKVGANSSRIELKEESPTIFGLVNRYLYTGVITSQDWQSLAPFPLYTLCDVWILAYHLGVPALVNHVIWCLLKCMDERRGDEAATIMPGNVETVYVRAPLESKLRKLLLDMCVWEFEDFKQSIKAPSQMGWDLFEAMKQKQRVEKSPLLDIRNYYTKEEEMMPVEAKVTVEPISDQEPSRLGAPSQTKTTAERPIIGQKSQTLASKLDATAPLKPPPSDQESPTLTPKTQVETAVVSSTPDQKPGWVFSKLEVKKGVEPPTSDQKVEATAALSNTVPVDSAAYSDKLQTGIGLFGASKPAITSLGTNTNIGGGLFRAPKPTSTGSGASASTLFGQAPTPGRLHSLAVLSAAAQEALPECTGTGSVPYNPYIDNDGFAGNQQVKYDNICAMTQYSKYSPEELRLADTQPKQEIITIDSDSEAATEVSQDLPSRVRVSGF